MYTIQENENLEINVRIMCLHCITDTNPISHTRYVLSMNKPITASQG